MFDCIIADDIHEELIVTPYSIAHHACMINDSMVSAESTCLAAAPFTFDASVSVVCIKALKVIELDLTSGTYYHG